MLCKIAELVARAAGRASGAVPLRYSVIALALLACVLPAGAAASSGGAGAGPPSQPAPATTPVPRAQSRSPLGSRGMWIWYVSQSSGGQLSSIVSTARTYGLSTVFIKSGDGATYWSQFNSTLVAELHAAHLRVCAWQYVYGAHPIFEAEVGAAAVHAGADCLLIDAESEYQSRYVQAQAYVRKLRRLVGSSYPLALAGFPYVDYHPSFPYSVFLGPGGAQYNAPQMYWHDIGTSVDEVFAHTYSYNLIYGRPIDPLGEVAGNPPPGQVIRFRQVSRAYAAGGVSWWDWQESSAREWGALARAAPNLAGYTTQAVLPTLTPKGAGGIWAGDLVVWAQEHLVSAGYPVTIDGDYGAETQTAVEQFQTTKGLPVTGLLDQTTWQALLRYPPADVTWTTQKHKTTASPARALPAGTKLVLAAPRSAHMPARGYEIPPDLGAGAPRHLGRSLPSHPAH